MTAYDFSGAPIVDVLTERTLQLHDDLLDVRRLSDEDRSRVQNAVIHAQETCGFWPNLADDQVWHTTLLPLALEFLGVDYDEVYPVTVEPRTWKQAA